jgi:NNP family nitrate/nitrite transporter-like MFS transporter
MRFSTDHMRERMNEGDSEARAKGDAEGLMGKAALPEHRGSAGELSTLSSGGSAYDPPVVQLDAAGAEEEAADAVVNNNNLNMEVAVNNNVTESAATPPVPVEDDYLINPPPIDDDENPHHDETSVAISDISGSTPVQSSVAHVDAGWMEATTFEPRQSFAVSDCGSMRSLRENVDRLLMAGTASSIGGSDIEARSCMEVDVDPTFAHTYDQNYYRSGDWLRFVPRKSNVSSQAGTADDPSHEGDFQQVPYGHQPRAPDYNPDRYFRGFDNTLIRRHSRVDHNATATRRIYNQYGVQSEHDHGFCSRGKQHSISEEPIDEEGGKDWSNRGGMNQHFPNPPMQISMQLNPTPEVFPADGQDALEGREEYETTIQNVGQDPQLVETTEYFRTSLREEDKQRPPSQSPPPQYEASLSTPQIISREDQMHLASWDSKYESYACRVDQSQEDSSVEIAIFSAARPHMRAFHYAWLTFFFAFFAWFSATPLLPEIQTSLKLSKEQIWASSICSAAGAVVTRCIAGLLCDIYGARMVAAVILVVCGVPTMFTGLVNTAAGLSALRLINGIGGSAFVTCQYWTSTMFTREVSGTANALAAGWGNLGGGIAQIFVGTMLFPLFKLIYSKAGTQQDPATLAWRTCCIIPGLICAGFSYFVIRYSDDSPKGNYHKRKQLGLMQKHSAWKYIKAALSDHNTWLLVLMYGCCFGVEITTTNAAALYFTEEFKLSTESAAAVAFTFGGMNLFARGLGGFLSDASNAYWGMRGRLIWQLTCFALEGAFIMLFSKAKSLAGSITALMTFSIFVQGAEGSTFGIVPYLNPGLTGTVAGIIGAGGNAGAVVFSIMFQQLPYRNAFFWMGASTTCISILSTLVWIKGYEGLFFRRRVLPNPQKRSKSTTQHATDVSGIDSVKTPTP